MCDVRVKGLCGTITNKLTIFWLVVVVSSIVGQNIFVEKQKMIKNHFFGVHLIPHHACDAANTISGTVAY